MQVLSPAKFTMSTPPITWFWVFVYEAMGKYTIYSDDQLGDDGRQWDMHDEGFELLLDSAQSRSEVVRYMEEFHPAYSRFEPIPSPPGV